jgi:hypothetical protein
MCRFMKKNEIVPGTNDKMSQEELSNYKQAVRILQRQVVKTGMLLGASRLEGMERGVAEIKLAMILEQFITPGCLEPCDRYQALKWFNWAVEIVNEIRAAVGSEVLLIQTGFRRPLHSWS